jgi:hypothetical protein
LEEANPVGQQILMNGQQLLEITGVVEPSGPTRFDYDVFLYAPPLLDESWTWRDPSYVLLHPDTDIKAFEIKIAGFLNKTIPNPLPGDFLLKLVPVERANLAFGKQKEFLLFSGIAILLSAHRGHQLYEPVHRQLHRADPGNGDPEDHRCHPGHPQETIALGDFDPDHSRDVHCTLPGGAPATTAQ